MSYRYPFTPFPKGWYRFDANTKRVLIFGREFKLEGNNPDNYILREVANPDYHFSVLQKNGNWYVFYDEEQKKPYFEVPDVIEFNNKNWQKPFHLSWKGTRVHIQEVAENALDLSHFCTVHTYTDIPMLSRFHTFGHQFNVVMHSRRKVLGVLAETTMNITYYGMGITVAEVMASNDVTLKVLLTTTPIGVELVDIDMAIAIRKTRNPIKNLFLSCYLPFEIKAEFSRDIPVWETKVYRDKPVVCSADANIIRVRKWAKQFYQAACAQ